MAMKLATTVGEKFDLCQILSLFYFYSIIHLEQAAKKTVDESWICFILRGHSVQNILSYYLVENRIAPINLFYKMMNRK